MLKSLIISTESSNLYSSKRFLLEAKTLRMKAFVQNPYEVSLVFNNKRPKQASGLYLHRTSGIRYDDFDLLIADYYKAQGHHLINDIEAIRPFREKDSQILFLNKHNINTIPSLVFRGEMNDHFFSQLNDLSSHEKYVVKMNRGNGGVGVQLINGLDSLTSILETFKALKDQKMLIQPFIAHTKEWRIFITQKGLIEVIERKISPNDFRANKNRAQAKWVKRPTKNLLEFGLNVFSKTNLHYAGLDIIETKDGFKVCEVNSVPGFEQIENLANKNIAREILLLQ